MYFSSGTRNGIQQWRLADGQDVGKQPGMDVGAISVSRDQKWVVCGTVVYGIKFAPDSDRIATLCSSYGDLPIRIFDSNNGDQLLSIENLMTYPAPLTPIAWSTDSQRLFAISNGHKIKSFDSSTGSQLAEWQIHANGDPKNMSIAVSPNNNLFIASSSGHFLSFWDTSTHTQLGIIEDTERIYSITFSHDVSHLARGSLGSGRIIVWDLGGIVPESYLPTKVSILMSILTFIHRLCFRARVKSLLDPNPECQWSSCSAIDSRTNARD